ncbi:MAG: 2'-5' RNA ligase family protein [Candidatus Pacearchaeota archaeon]
MKYVLVYLLSGEAKKYNERLMKETADISGERHVVDVSQLPSHVTIKSPFEFSSYKKLESFLKGFTANRIKAKIDVNGFGNFRRFVSFMKTDFSKEAKKTQRELVRDLETELEIKPHEFDVKHKPHATICYGNTKETFDIIWNYLRTQKKPKYSLSLDNLTLLYKPKGKWKVKKRFNLI